MFSRSSVWIYLWIAPPRFTGTPALMVTAGSYEMADILTLPAGSDVAVELYGRECALRFNGENNRA